jgi:hypothetical protein
MKEKIRRKIETKRKKKKNRFWRWLVQKLSNQCPIGKLTN